MRSFIYIIVSLGLLQTCGREEKKPEDENTGQASAPPGPNTDNKSSTQSAPASQDAVTAPAAQLWTSSNTSRFIAGYDLKGNRLTVVDLSNYAAAGGVGGLTFLTRNTLIALLDPGTSGERFVKIELSGDNAASINPGWHSDTTNFNNVTVPRLLKQNDSRFLAVKQGTQIEAIGYSLPSGIVTRLGNPWIGTVGSCSVTANQSISLVSVGSSSKLVGLSSGTNSRINVYGSISGVPTCDSTYNFASSFPGATAYMPTGAAQGYDGNIYVRFQHATTPMIARYAFDGTTLSAGTAVLSDAGYLSADIVSREFVTEDGKIFFFANWSANSVLSWNAETGETQFLIHDGFSNAVNAIAVRPTH